MNKPNSISSQGSSVIKSSDKKAIYIALLWIIPVLFQLWQSNPPSDWKRKDANILSSQSAVSKPISRSTRRRTFIDAAEIEYEFSVDGKSYRKNKTSPICLIACVPDLAAQGIRANESIEIFYDPKNPDKSECPKAEIAFTTILFWNYGIAIFLVGIVGLTFEGMNALKPDAPESRLEKGWLSVTVATLIFVGLWLVPLIPVIINKATSSKLSSLEALDDYHHALTTNSNDYEAYMKKANAENSMLKTTEAIGDYTQAIRIRPDSPEPYRKRAELYDRTFHADLAQKDREKAESLSH